jgi:ABC-type lipoprotein export system ATPase subunit
MINDNTILKIEQGYKHYANTESGIFALYEINASFKTESFNLILGESGSGKTTLLKLLSGLIQPSKGTVILKGDNLGELDYAHLAELRRKYYGFIFPEIGLLEHLKCFENIQFPELDFEVEKVKNLAEYFGIINCLQKYPNQISQGEKQRAIMARALYNEPKIIMADEPTANLDWKNAKKSIELLKEYSLKGNAVFIATHEERILEYSTSMIRLEKGKVIEKK